MPGMMLSVMTRSGNARCTFASPSSPLGRGGDFVTLAFEDGAEKGQNRFAVVDDQMRLMSAVVDRRGPDVRPDAKM